MSGEDKGGEEGKEAGKGKWGGETYARFQPYYL
jgi:hypothetical protein